MPAMDGGKNNKSVGAASAAKKPGQFFAAEAAPTLLKSTSPAREMQSYRGHGPLLQLILASSHYTSLWYNKK